MLLDVARAQKLREGWGIHFFPKLKNSVQVTGLEYQFERFTQFLPGQFLPLGAYSYSQSAFRSVASIGRYCSIGSGVSVMGNAHPTDWVSTSPAFYNRGRSRRFGSEREVLPHFKDVSALVHIGHDVWIGDDVMFSHGVNVGTGSIVAARSVVTRDVPPYAVVAGVPAKIIRMRFKEPIVERLLDSVWWRWPFSCWDDSDPRDVVQFLDAASRVKETATPMEEERFKIADLLRDL